MEAKLGGGECRRLHIIYFLSHMGRVDHPHLIRVHHLTRSGVYLRDVKRWLADLRGKDIAEAYAWSFKRRYKTGYVWQDLLDDDLITPISDNEYVLKGSEIISATYDAPANQYVEKKGSTQKEEHAQLSHEVVEDHKLDHHQPPQPQQLLKQEFQTYPDSKTSSAQINQESPHFGSERSTLTDIEMSDESMKLEDQEDNNNKYSSETVTNNNLTDCEKPKEKFGSIPSSFYSNIPGMNKKKTTKKNYVEGTKDMEATPPNSLNSPSSSSSSKSSALPKSKSYSSGASNVLRNLMSCGAVNTNDEVLVMFNRRDHHNKSSSATTKQSSNDESSGIFKGDKLGGSARCFGTTSWTQDQQQQQQNYSPRESYEWSKDSYHSKKNQQQQKREFTNQKPVSAAYRPVREPNCSQCGKPFKPEKMHSHMKSCKGMKALAKATPTSNASMTSSYNDSASSCYLLTN